jgi:hypothetical protein
VLGAAIVAMMFIAAPALAQEKSGLPGSAPKAAAPGAKQNPQGTIFDDTIKPREPTKNAR